jgi:outer membrane autotransporter protein
MTVTCSGTTTDQNPPNGYGTGTTESGLTINVLTGASVSGTGAGGNGISINSDNQVNNSGSINGVNNGINALDTLTVINNVGASITGANTGIFNAGLGNVTNSGSITGTAPGSTGISINGSGSATISNSGTISGLTVGLFGGSGTSLAITNTGTISGGTADSGTSIISGSLNVTNSATLSGSVVSSSSTGTLILDNQTGGIVTSTNTAVSAGNTANVTNAGAITGNTFAVAANNDVAVTNSGIITTIAASGFAVQSQNGNVSISNSGTIAGAGGATNVVFAQVGDIDIVSNIGAITAGGQAVVASSGNVTFNNGTTGTISGGVTGIAASGGTISGTNAGTISGGPGGALSGNVVNVTNMQSIVATNPGIAVIFGFTSANINNNAGASITTTNGNGIDAGTVTLSNSGTVTGGGANGIGVVGSSLNVTNNQGATISGGLDGINQQAHTGAVINNAGTISGVARSGLRLDSNADVTNTGTITGLTGIVFRDATGTNTPVVNGIVFNSGTITGTGGTAINFSATPGSGPFTLTLGPGSVVHGNVLGTGHDLFQLGGTGADTFNVSAIGAAQQYQGFATFNKIDGSIWTLVGTNSGILPWAINGGTLVVNATMGNSTMTVNSGGTLEGIGTVGPITVNSGATLMPGLPASVGTLTAGPVTFASGATYAITINGAANSKLNSSGVATLNGATVDVVSGSTFNPGQKYTILTASGGVSGQFNPTVVGSFAALSPTLSYDANDAFLTFGFNRLAPLLPPGAPQNAINVANAIDNFTGNGGALPTGFQTLFGFPPGQLVNGLSQLDGENATGAQISSFQLMNQFMSLLLDPFTDGRGDGIGPIPFAPTGQQNTFTPEIANAYASVLKAPPTAPSYGAWRAWGAAYGGTESINGAPAAVGSHDITARVGGFAAGLDYRASPDTRFGFALAGAGTGWDLAQGFGSGHSDAFQAGVYGTHQFGNAYLSGALAFTNFWASTKRIVTVAGADTLEANFDAQSLGGRLEGGYRLQFQPITLTPYAALQAQSFHTPGYSETAASGSPQFALSFASQTSSAERAELGTWASRNFRLANGDSVSLFGRAAWAHDWFTNLTFTPTFQALPGASFVVNGVTPPADLGLVTAGAEWQMTSRWSLMGRFDGEFGNGAQAYTGTARLRYAW